MRGTTGAELSTSDAALIQKIVQRDESALAALYDRYASLLSSVLKRILRDTQAAEEILQDVFSSSGATPRNLIRHAARCPDGW